MDYSGFTDVSQQIILVIEIIFPWLNISSTVPQNTDVLGDLNRCPSTTVYVI